MDGVEDEETGVEEEGEGEEFGGARVGGRLGEAVGNQAWVKPACGDCYSKMIEGRTGVEQIAIPAQ